MEGSLGQGEERKALKYTLGAWNSPRRQGSGPTQMQSKPAAGGEAAGMSGCLDTGRRAGRGVPATPVPSGHPQNGPPEGTEGRQRG